MAELILFTACSLDGFIAGPKGEIDWLFQDSDYGYTDFYSSIGSMVMGYKTFEVVNAFEGPYPHLDRENYVFSRSKHEDREAISFISEDPVQFIKRLKEEKTDDIWLVGGGLLNGMMLENELIDEMVLSIHPLTLGHGIPLFAQHPFKVVKFDLVNCVNFPSGMIQLTYRKKNPLKPE